MEYRQPDESIAKPPRITPRIIIHGGAGNVTRDNVTHSSYKAYRYALLDIVESAYAELIKPGSSALDIATGAVALLEENPLFNAGKGAVYTTAGTHELEASVMVSKGYNKRGVGVMNVKKSKSPIKLAREMLIRGNLADGGGAGGHCQLQGEICDELNEQWGLETVKPSYFWTRKRWDEHRRGLLLPHDDETYEKHRRAADGDDSDIFSDQVRADHHFADSEKMMVGDIHWDGKEYLPQGTVGAVVLDSTGTLCAATSTGGLTNKLPGRIGDTPTLGAGFWLEEWETASSSIPSAITTSPLSQLASLVSDCLPGLRGYNVLPKINHAGGIRGVAMSGTGNGDSFLRVNAVRTAAAIARYSNRSLVPLQAAVTAVAGPNGQLQLSAGDRWRRTGEGEGGIIGIELSSDGEGHVVFDYNCGGMFHAWIDQNGHPRFKLFQDDKGFQYR